MAAIPATQLTAQLFSSMEGVAAASSVSEAGADAGLPFLFADLLAQQLGVGVDGQAVSEDQLVDLDDFSDGDVVADVTADTGAPEGLIQLQQALIPPPVVPVVTQSAPQASDDGALTSIDSRSPAGLNAVMATLADSVKAEPQPTATSGTTMNFLPERQAVAGELAIVADSEVGQNVPLPSGVLPEQAARMSQQAAVSTPSAPPVAGAIAQPVSSPAWGDMLGDRVMWMVGQQQQSAELRLNPPALGPLEVKLSMTDGQATLTFSTHHLPVKEALEAATPRLKEMFGESGINLGSVSVNVGTSPQQQQGETQFAQNGNAHWSGDAQNDNQLGANVSAVVTELRRQGSGMVDYFA